MSPKQAKQPWEYSTNKNTVRARARKARLNDYQRELEQSKSSDAKAVTRAWKLRAETDAYKRATRAEQEAILKTTEKEVLARRRQRGLDQESKVLRFMERMNNTAHDRGSPSVSATLESPDPVDADVDPSVDDPVVFGPSPSHSAEFHPILSYQDTHVFAPQHNMDTGSNDQINCNDIGHRHVNTFSSPASFHVERSGVDYHQLPFPQMQRGYEHAPVPAYPNERMQPGLAAAIEANLQLQGDLHSRDNRIRQLEHQVGILSFNLTATQSSVAALETRMAKMQNLMAIYSDADGYRQIAAGYRQITTGSQAIANFAAGVANRLESNSGSSDAGQDSEGEDME